MERSGTPGIKIVRPMPRSGITIARWARSWRRYAAFVGFRSRPGVSLRSTPGYSSYAAPRKRWFLGKSRPTLGKHGHWGRLPRPLALPASCVRRTDIPVCPIACQSPDRQECLSSCGEKYADWDARRSLAATKTAEAADSHECFTKIAAPRQPCRAFRKRRADLGGGQGSTRARRSGPTRMTALEKPYFEPSQPKRRERNARHG